jgi:hypothetical protein
LAPFVKNTMVEFLYPNGIPRQHQHSDTRLEDRSEESFWATATLDKIRSVWTCQVASTKLVGSNIKCNYQEVKKKQAVKSIGGEYPSDLGKASSPRKTKPN